MPDMSLPLVRMEPAAARAKLLAYRAAVHEAGEKLAGAADRLLEQAFYHASLGRPVISLTEAMHQAGLEPFTYHALGRDGPRTAFIAMRPKLAIAPATAARVWLRLLNQEAVFRFNRDDRGNAGQTRTVSRDGAHIQVRFAEFLPAHRNQAVPQWCALVPTVPPEHRPRGQGRRPAGVAAVVDKLAGYHVLWEAQWRAADPPAPRDPALLKHIGGDLFVVRAVWDLTELERLVLATPR